MMRLPRVRWPTLGRLLLPALLLATLLLLAGCDVSDLDQNTFAAEGEVARKQRDLLIYWVLGPATIILILVTAAIIYVLVRFRRTPENDTPVQLHGNTRLEIAWTIAPAILLMIIAVPVVVGIADLGRAPAADALHVRVTGLQWRWQFEYIDPEYVDAEGKPLRVFDQMHIPVGREIGLDLTSMDVIHSFWVPRLAGKQDAVPGRTNQMWLSADSSGSFSGQCAEFCGLSHADMLLTVVAQEEGEFDEWIEGELVDAAPAAGEPEEAMNGE
jgi:cytochrome c oxidase subunit 2